jgi:G6PDH family F420-dependent oxidoreductase
MAQFGYALSSEEHPPNDLVRYAQRAEAVGFTFALISDHFHPWISAQGHSPFVWSVIGAIAHATDNLRLGTGVTCPTMRIHPAIIAQAAATSAAMMPGRFFLGVGTGENLNEHVTGNGWPPYDVRAEMLAEAVDAIRRLWSGETISMWGDYYIVEDARLFTLPPEPPALFVAGSGPKSVSLAGEIGDGLISVTPEEEVIDTFAEAGGADKPRYGQLTMCWAESEEEARNIVYERWPNAGLTGSLTQELRTVTHLEQAVQMLSKDQATKYISCGPDPQVHLAAIHRFLDAGFDHVAIHQIGRDQEAFFRFYEEELRPALR